MTTTPLCTTCRGDCCSNESGSRVVAHGAALSLHRCPDCPDGYALPIDLAAARLAALWDAERENTALRLEVAWLRSDILPTEPCATCGHPKWKHHDYRNGEGHDVTKCWGRGFDRDDCHARCVRFVRHSHHREQGT
jgi:hypothetical protein